MHCRSRLADWDAWLPALERLADRLQGEDNLADGAVELLTPVPDPGKLLAVGADDAGHLVEMGLSVEEWDSTPFVMWPPTTTLVGPGPTVRIPHSTRQCDRECELAVFVGWCLRHADRAKAATAVAGYPVGLDLSCRDLRITLSVHGETMIDARTSEMLDRVDDPLSIISRYVTLDPATSCSRARHPDRRACTATAGCGRPLSSGGRGTTTAQASEPGIAVTVGAPPRRAGRTRP